MHTVSIATIRSQLEAAFAPTSLEIIDESQKHAGHAGRQGLQLGDISHVRVRISSTGFEGKSRVEIHRAINNALKPSFDAGLHALAIEVIA
jgi:BolA protein